MLLAVVGVPAHANAKPLIKAADKRPRPRLQIAVSPILGPYSPGELDCRPRGSILYCEQGGSFLGAGMTFELRVKTFGPLYFHARGLLVGNVHRRPYAVHDGLGGAGFGLGIYAQRAFLRAEYLSIDTLGSPLYRPPFGALEGAKDDYGHHAGLISGGARLPFGKRWNAELWGGMLFGPRAVRTTPHEVSVADRTMISFILGLGISFDVLTGA
ncbi:MAG TPA: hypothetical protein ENK31_05340 [Nannocystis exedens]|nr:hypothetical protein [Nannocystis exedens]